MVSIDFKKQLEGRNLTGSCDCLDICPLRSTEVTLFTIVAWPVEETACELFIDAVAFVWRCSYSPVL